VNDTTRLATAILLEELASLASNLAARLRGQGDLPPIAVGRLLVDAAAPPTPVPTSTPAHAPPIPPPAARRRGAAGPECG
jgi:hypothetical protein